MLRRFLWPTWTFVVLTVFACGACLGQVEPAPPTLRVPRAVKAPVIDGKIDEPQWQKAAAVTGIVSGGFKLSPRQATFMLLWDEDRLYYAVRSVVEPGDNLAPTGGPTAADTVEFCLFPMGREKPAPDAPERGYQLIFGSKGLALSKVFYPRVMQNDPTPWQPAIDFASRVIPDPNETFGPGTRLWEVEFSITRMWLNLKQPNKAGDPWRLHFVRNYANPRAQLPIPVTKGFFNPDGFAHVTLADHEPVVRLTDVLPLLRGESTVGLSVVNPTDKPVTVSVNATVQAGKDEAAVAKSNEVKVPAGETITVGDLGIELPPDWHKTNPALGIKVTQGERTLFDWSARVNRSVALMRRLQQAARPDAGAMTVEVKQLVYGRYPSGTFYVDEKGVETKLTGMCGPGSRPRFSPDGKRVAMASTWGGRPGVWIIDIQSRKSRRLCDGGDPSWIDDESLVCVVDGRLHRVAAADGALVRLTPEAWADCTLPEVGPDGAHVFFVRPRPGKPDAVFGLSLKDEKAEPAEVHLGVKGKVLGLRRFTHPAGLALLEGDRVRLAVMDGAQVGWFRDVPVPGQVADMVVTQDMQWPVMAVGPHGRPGRDLYACVLGFPGATKLLKENVDDLFDIRFKGMYMPPAERAARGFRVTREGNAWVVRHAGGNFACRMNAPRQPEAYGPSMVTVAGPDQLMITGAVAAVIVPDRFGDDLVLTAPIKSTAALPSATVLLADADGGLFAVCSDKPGIRVKSLGRGLLLSVAERSGVVLGRVGGSVGRPGGRWIAPFDAVWRVARTDKLEATMVGDAGETLVERLDEALAGGAPVLAYPMLRRVETPVDVWTVMDFMTAAGTSRDDAVLGFRVAAKPTVWPTVQTTAEAIAQGYRLRWQTRIPNDMTAWAAEIPILLQSIRTRLAEYDKARARLDELLGKLPEEVRGKLTAGIEWPVAAGEPTDEDRAALMKSLTDAAVDKKDDLLKACAQAKALSEKWTTRLKTERQQWRKLRNHAMKTVAERRANDYDDETGRLLLEVFELTGTTLSNRHYAEDDWRGEPVEHPFQRAWWGNVF